MSEPIPFADFERQLREGVAFASESPTVPQEGARVAWTLKGYGGVTRGLSSVHRVAVTGDEMVAFCGETIPSTRNLIPVLRSLDVCPICANAYAKLRIVA